MEPLEISDKQRQIAIDAFVKMAEIANDEYEKQLANHELAKISYANSIAECKKGEERINDLVRLIRKFGGAKDDHQFIMFDLEEITESNYHTFITEQEAIDKEGKSNINSVKEINEDIDKDGEDGVDKDDTVEGHVRRRAKRVMGIRDKVREIFSESKVPLSTMLVYTQLRQEIGPEVKYNSVNNAIVRFWGEEFLTKTKEGLYDLAERYDESGNKRLDAKEEFNDGFIQKDESFDFLSTLGLRE